MVCLCAWVSLTPLLIQDSFTVVSMNGRLPTSIIASRNTSCNHSMICITSSTLLLSPPPSGVYSWSGQCGWRGQPVCVEVWGGISAAQQDPRLWVRSELYYSVVIFGVQCRIERKQSSPMPKLHHHEPWTPLLLFLSFSIYHPSSYVVVLCVPFHCHLFLHFPSLP